MNIKKVEKTYKINEIFYSIQGEGLWAGHAAVFVRFAHCNLSCVWCDTDYDHGEMMTAPEIVDTIMEEVNGFKVSAPPLIVFTGGEPSMWIDQDLINHFQLRGFSALTMETNGILWKDCMIALTTITVSPKTFNGWWSLKYPIKSWRVQKELSPKQIVMKIVHDPSNPEYALILQQARGMEARAFFLQPLEDQDTKATNVKELVPLIKANPDWRLSLQTHKILGVR